MSEHEKPEATPVELQREIESLRGELEGLVEELDRRRHAFDPRVQLRKHARPIAIGAALSVCAIGVAVALRRRRHRPGMGEQLVGLAREVVALGRGPARLDRADYRWPAMASDLAKSAALAAATAAVRRAAVRAVDR